MKKISKRDLIILAIILTGFSIFVIPKIVLTPHGIFFHKGKEGVVYYCPMHPTYTSNRPGDCPICNMKLVPREGGKDQGEVSAMPSKVSGHATVQIPDEKQQLMGVKLGTVEKRKLSKEIRTVGRVAFDPELYTAQQEFLSAVGSAMKSRGGPYHEPMERSQALVESSRIRLRLLGMSEAEILELEKRATQDRNLILPAETSKKLLTSIQDYVWVYGTIYEYELPFVKVGSKVTVKVPTFPDHEFNGEVRALDPVLDPTTRSIRMRAKVDNSEGLLKPEMYVDLYLSTDLTEGLVVPEEAVMLTGERALVFVARAGGSFEPREVKLGTQVGNFYEVKEGLIAGESIVTSGNFLIDSESKLQAALQGMTGGGHQHGQ